MRLLLQIILLVLYILVLSSCNKCEQQQIAALRFTPEELKINPYTGDEMLIFKDLNGDTISFPRGTRSTEHMRIYQYDYEAAKLDHQGCQGNYFDCDINHMSKIIEELPAWLDIKLYFHYSLDNPNSDKLIAISFFIKDKPHLGFAGSYYFNSDTLFSIGAVSPKYRDSIIAFHSSLTIGPKVFHNAYELFCYNKDPRDSIWISIAYYSINEGLIGFKSSDDKTWYLDNTN